MTGIDTGKTENDPPLNDDSALDSTMTDIDDESNPADSIDHLFVLTKDDILGPDPGTSALDSPAWKKFQSLIGMSHVKESILGLLQLVQTNYWRELQERPLLKRG